MFINLNVEIPLFTILVIWLAYILLN